MGFRERRAPIEALELLRGSRIICYFTQTRPNTNAQIGMDAVSRIYEHLRAVALGPDAKIELLLHSNGGDGVVPWRLVSLIREHCKEFNVLIPNRAFSAATLISLGADGIFMHPMGMLGPTDPTVANAFNPADPANPQQKLGIPVEDLYAYISLIKEDLGIKGESELVQAFRTLTEQLHPLALGNVKRFYAQSRMMAKKLLELHMDKKQEHSAINEIADALTSKLFFHGHPINRVEAKDLGLKVKPTTAEEERLIWEIYLDFAKEMKLDEAFLPLMEFMNAAAAPLGTVGTLATVPLAPLIHVTVDSAFGQHTMSQRIEAIGSRAANLQVSASFLVTHEGWDFQPAAALTAPPPAPVAAPPHAAQQQGNP